MHSKINLCYDTSCIDANVVIYVDSFKFAQVFRNVLSNAFKFTPSGGEIVVSAEVLKDGSKNSSDSLPNGSLVRFSVKDTGCGISKVCD